MGGELGRLPKRMALRLARGACAGVAITLALAARGEGGAACTLVFGHGRNLSDEMPQVNALWDELNHAFNRRVATELGADGRRIVAMVLGVESNEPRANAGRLLERASDEGCDQVVETTVFGDAGTAQLIARLRLHPILRPPGPPRADAPWIIGPATTTVQRELPLTARSLERVGSHALARQLAAEVMDRSTAGPHR